MTLGLARDRINDEIMKSKQEGLKKNIRENKLESKKEDWKLNAHRREDNLEMLRGPWLTPWPCTNPWFQNARVFTWLCSPLHLHGAPTYTT